MNFQHFLGCLCEDEGTSCCLVKSLKQENREMYSQMLKVEKKYMAQLNKIEAIYNTGFQQLLLLVWKSFYQKRIEIFFAWFPIFLIIS